MLFGVGFFEYVGLSACAACLGVAAGVMYARLGLVFGIVSALCLAGITPVMTQVMETDLFGALFFTAFGMAVLTAFIAAQDG